MDKRVPESEVPEGLNFIEYTTKAAEFVRERQPPPTESIRGTLTQMGTLLSLLDRLSSCWWGCTGGNHVLHYLVVRGCSNTVAGIQLTNLAFYDEALALARNVAEVGNLLWLFAVDNNSIDRWVKADRRERLRTFSPRAVRDAIEKCGAPLPIGQDTYSELSEMATHVTPEINPQTHKAGERPKTGGILYDANAAERAIEHLALGLAVVGSGGCRVVPSPKEQFDRINKETIALIRRLGASDVAA